MKKWGPERASLLFTDTDSLTYWTETEDVYKDVLPDIPYHFDTSKYPDKHPSGTRRGINSGAIGNIFKDELTGHLFASFAV